MNKKRQAEVGRVSAGLVLTEAVAQEFLKNPDSVQLSAYSEIADAAARELAKHRDRLELNGLMSISASAAKALSRHKDGLYLNGLAVLSEDVAKALAKTKGSLSLCGLGVMKDEVADALSQHSDSLYLDGVKSLTDRAAASLARHSGSLSLNGLTVLRPDIARELLSHRGHLYLDGLKTLSDDVAEALSQHVGHLSLAGLGKLSELSARALSKHESQGRISQLRGKLRQKIPDTTNRITIQGPFYQVTIAEIDRNTASKLLSGQFDKEEWLSKVESFPSRQCVYGTESPKIYLNNELLLDEDEVEERAGDENRKIFARSADTFQYPIETLYLEDRPKNKYFFICREVCEGEEHREFSGEFKDECLSINRISVWADEEIVDVFQIDYADSVIVDETGREYDAFYVFHNGELRQLD